MQLLNDLPFATAKNYIAVQPVYLAALCEYTKNVLMCRIVTNHKTTRKQKDGNKLSSTCPNSVAFYNKFIGIIWVLSPNAKILLIYKVTGNELHR